MIVVQCKFLLHFQRYLDSCIICKYWCKISLFQSHCFIVFGVFVACNLRKGFEILLWKIAYASAFKMQVSNTASLLGSESQKPAPQATLRPSLLNGRIENNGVYFIYVCFHENGNGHVQCLPGSLSKQLRKFSWIVYQFLLKIMSRCIGDLAPVF